MPYNNIFHCNNFADILYIVTYKVR